MPLFQASEGDSNEISEPEQPKQPLRERVKIDELQEKGKALAKHASHAYVILKGTRMRGASSGTIIGELDREQEAFIAQVNASRLSEVGDPWEGLPDTELAKKKILELSLNPSNFTREAPGESEYDVGAQQAMAKRLIEIDPNLRRVRFELVPKQVKEEQFWRNYFYRVSLVRRSVIQKTSGRSTPSASLVDEVELFHLQNRCRVEDEPEASTMSDISAVSTDETEKSQTEECNNEEPRKSDQDVDEKTKAGVEPGLLIFFHFA
ncbi:unnamed protein product [Nippostrongylus brasiliensis]|uniref:Synapse-associated protein 1 (inferred by orthology to a human protein) n=1 Tax=Nippostrongylus brasiliensis TaxID=27835 RepID=A0A0N4XJA2_NIPBR|nr:unnamed protein product [Nippostrongylus brasiliensis]